MERYLERAVTAMASGMNYISISHTSLLCFHINAD